MPEEKRIDFIVAGVQKAGTTTIDAILRNHASIQMASAKEVHFFDRDDRGLGGRLRLGGPPALATIASMAFTHRESRLALYEHYHHNWDWAAPKLRGEATPCYLRLPTAIERMADYHAGMKVICTFRNPIDRAWSNWRMVRNNGVERLDFRAAIACENERLNAGINSLDYLRRSRYGEQLERLYSHFPREQCLLLRFDELEGSTSTTSRRLFEFLGVPPLKPSDPVHMKKGLRGELGPPADLVEMIAHELEEDLQRFEALTGWDCGDWRTSSQPPMSLAEERRMRRRYKWRDARVDFGRIRRNLFGPGDPLEMLLRWGI